MQAIGNTIQSTVQLWSFTEIIVYFLLSENLDKITEKKNCVHLLSSVLPIVS